MPTPDELLAELESQVTPLENATPFFKMLCAGVMGAGKTTNTFRLAQLITPPDKDILYIDAVEGWVSLDNHPEWNLKRRVRRIQFEAVSQLSMIAYAIKGGRGTFANVGCVILDEASRMADKVLGNVTAARAARDKDKDPDEPKQPDYLVTKTQFGKIEEVFVSLPCHVFFLSHIREDKEKTGGIKIRPAFNPGLGMMMAGDFHIVGFASALEQSVGDKTLYQRIVQVNPTQTVDAKTRISFGDTVYVTWDKLIEGVSEWVNGRKQTLSVEQMNSVEKVIEPSNDTSTSDVDQFEGIEV